MSTVALGKYKSVTVRITWILRIKVQKIIVKRRDKVGHGHTAAKGAVTDFAGCDTDVSPDLICLASQFFYALWTNIHIKNLLFDVSLMSASDWKMLIANLYKIMRWQGASSVYIIQRPTGDQKGKNSFLARKRWIISHLVGNYTRCGES